MADSRALLHRIRWCLGLFILGMVLSGVTAFPLEHETGWLDDLVQTHLNPDRPTPLLAAWIHAVSTGLQTTYGQYPWIGYGTDWLAFAHIIIAIFFIGPFINPVRNIWVLQAGMVACALVIPLAMICGWYRHIPFGWRLIDCTFGIVGFVPLYWGWRLTRQLEQREKMP